MLTSLYKKKIHEFFHGKKSLQKSQIETHIQKKLLARAKTLAQGVLSNNIIASDLVMLFRGSAAAMGSITLSAPLMQPEKTERDHSHFQGLQQRSIYRNTNRLKDVTLSVHKSNI